MEEFWLMIGSIAAAVAAIGALIAAFFSGRSSKAAKTAMLQHVLEDIRKDYRSPEMHHAVKTLWQFYNDCKEKDIDFVEEYCKKLNEDEERLSGLEERQRIETERSTLHYQRRLVSHFYQYLAALHDNGILPNGIVFKTWTEENLRIIPNIIIPIEIKLRGAIRTPPLQPVDEHNLPDSLSVLYRLYRDSKKSEEC